MKKLFAMFAICFSFVAAMMVSFAAFAQEIIPVTNEDFIKLLLESIGGISGASTMAIVLIAVKLIVAFLGTDLSGRWFKKLTGEGKLTVVLLLTFVGGVVGLMLPPTSLALGAALVHSTTLSAFTVLLNQLYKHYIEKKSA